MSRTSSASTLSERRPLLRAGHPVRLAAAAKAPRVIPGRALDVPPPCWSPPTRRRGGASRSPSRAVQRTTSSYNDISSTEAQLQRARASLSQQLSQLLTVKQLRIAIQRRRPARSATSRSMVTESSMYSACTPEMSEASSLAEAGSLSIHPGVDGGKWDCRRQLQCGEPAFDDPNRGGQEGNVQSRGCSPTLEVLELLRPLRAVGQSAIEWTGC